MFQTLVKSQKVSFSYLMFQKVVKSERDLTPEEQFKHDEKVAANWILLRKGKLEISDSLRSHCLKFTNREARSTSSKGRNGMHCEVVSVGNLPGWSCP